MFGNPNPTQVKLLTGSALLKKATGLGTITGILCAQSSNLVISIWDGQDATGTLGPTTKIVDSLPMTAGNPYPIPAKLNNGLYVQFVSGSGSISVFYD
jgi:hypothetical protein